MATRVYACLLGEWVDITDTESHIGALPVKEWLEKGTPLDVEGPDKKELFDYQERILKSPFVDVFYKGKIYSISPIFLQIVR